MITTRAPDGANKIIIKHHNDHDIFSCPIHKENHLWYCKLGSSPLLLTSLVIVQVAQKKRKSIAAAVCTDGEKHQKPNINLLKPVQPFSFESGPGSVSVIPWRRCFSAKMFQLQTIISTMVLVPYLASTQKYSKWHFFSIYEVQSIQSIRAARDQNQLLKFDFVIKRCLRKFGVFTFCLPW